MILQIDVPEVMSKELKIFKIKNNFNTQAQAVLFILNEKLMDCEEDGTRGE